MASSGPPPMSANLPDPKKPGPQPLANQGLVIAPEPLRLGNCRLRLGGQTRRRLVAPLALHVSLQRTDKTQNGLPIELLPDGKWIVTPSNPELSIPPLIPMIQSKSFPFPSALMRSTIRSSSARPAGPVSQLGWVCS